MKLEHFDKIGTQDKRKLESEFLELFYCFFLRNSFFNELEHFIFRETTLAKLSKLSRSNLNL